MALRRLTSARLVLSALALLAAFCAPASAQSEPVVPAAPGAPAALEEFAASATAVDAQTLLTDRYVVKLWGIEAAEIFGTPLKLQARTVLDDMIAGGAVKCRVMSWSGKQPVAQCATSGESDIALAMLQQGFAVVDRPAVLGSVFQDPYFKAERSAKEAGAGAWRNIWQGGGSASISQDKYFPLMLIALGAVPLLGFACMALVGVRGFRRLAETQVQQMGLFLQREDKLRDREKFVMAAILEAELNSNRVKIEAFLVVYQDLMKGLRDTSRQPKYRQTGEIIHEQPMLSRTVFDGNTQKLDLLGPKLAGEIASLYASIQPNPNYITLEPDMPVETAAHKVEQIMSAAQAMQKPMDHILAALQVIIRGKKDGAANAELAAPPMSGRPIPGAPQKRRA